MHQLYFSDTDGKSLNTGESLNIQLGLLYAKITRMPHEWQLEYCHGAEIEKTTFLAYSENTVKRFITSGDNQTVLLQPKLADRAIVSQPLTPIELLPGTDITLYVSTTLWVGVSIGEQELLELPAARLSDTWFGPNTLTGELSYASTTRVRLDLSLLEHLPYKAITPIRIHNRGEINLQLARINVPITNLALYQCDDLFWTSPMTISCDSGLERAHIDISSNPPPHINTAQLIAQPRKYRKTRRFS